MARLLTTSPLASGRIWAGTSVAMCMITTLTAPLAASAAPSGPPPESCLVNSTGAPIVLMLRTPAGERRLKRAGSGEALCLPTAAPLTAMSFASEDALEGCSTELPPGTTIRLLAHEDFDRCTWSEPVATAPDVRSEVVRAR